MKRLALLFALFALALPATALAQDDDDSGGGNRWCVLVATNTPNPYYVCSG